MKNYVIKKLTGKSSKYLFPITFTQMIGKITYSETGRVD